jgi:hypothetical protein
MPRAPGLNSGRCRAEALAQLVDAEMLFRDFEAAQYERTDRAAIHSGRTLREMKPSRCRDGAYEPAIVAAAVDPGSA